MKTPRVYLDRGKPGLRYQRGGGLIPMQGRVPKVPTPPPLTRLKDIQRHNSLEPELQDTHRLLLRWSEREGSGVSNPEADIRETHYDPLPLTIQERITEIVDESPWSAFVRKLYASTLEKGSLAERLGISRAQLYIKRSESLWYFKGCFRTAGITPLVSPTRPRRTFGPW